MPRQHRIASIPADGIGPEVIAAGLEVLDAVAARDGGFTLMVDHYDWGSNWYRKHGELHAGRRAGLAAHRRRDLFRRGRRSEHPGPRHAVGPAAADLPGPRPVRQRPADAHPARRHLAAARRRPGRPGLGDRAGELAKASMPARAAARIAACPRKSRPRPRSSPAAASSGSCASPSTSPAPRPRKHLTVVTKSNAQRHGMVFWDEIAALVSHDYQDVTWDKELVDAMTMRMVRKPQLDRHRGGDQPARRHPVRPGRGAGRLAGHRADRQYRPGAALARRCSSRSMAVGVRHHRQGHRQPGRELLDRRDDAGAPRREARRRRC